MKCPHCGEEIERELRIELSTEGAKIQVEVTDTYGDETLERKTARTMGKLLAAIGEELGTPMKIGKVRRTEAQG